MITSFFLPKERCDTMIGNEVSIKDFFLTHGIKPSHHRIAIYLTMQSRKGHPTADDLFQQLHPKIPTLSKTTIYNTLNLFVEKGLVNAIQAGELEHYYEIVDHPHAHFKCTICQCLYDVDLQLSPSDSRDLEGFKIESSQITLSGICKKCVDSTLS
jgi:Fur family peroxide stress response transcriptional regulator